ncbi:class I SAM-dependent DNA methyltransferase [Nitrosococcus oceani]|uniref:class I SAM-dependent DNA methyltransferase n=1 Tax=Nitrosococcus oceani TaxID=1229 RepID=UPI0004E90FD3|nr:methyltransferase domain-containing protein [Nitrosococcus oceani]KFI24015.1 methyltransferase [Nitrosococcus oceani]
MRKRYRIQFPKAKLSSCKQDEAYFYLQEENGKRKIRFHDYSEIYQKQDLYEQIFYERLQCSSPSKVSSILEAAVKQSQDNFSELRILDLGAGNGMMGDELKKHGVSRLIGIDIVPEAYEATIRDRPGIYDAYYVEDFTRLDNDKKEEIKTWNCDCMVTVSALGFSDIPAKVFIEAFNIIKNEGWLAFNIKETFFNISDESGFSKMIRELIFSKYIDIYCIERYRHRFSIDGEPLYYFAVAGRKNLDIPSNFLDSKNILA